MIRFENISKRFSEQYVLNGFSFVVEKGDKVNISGRSGIGKTTLFKLLLGFEQPETGIIYFENKALTGKNCWEFRKKAAYVSQDLNIGTEKVSEFFENAVSLKANVYEKENYASNRDKWMSFFELPQALLDKHLDELSGGEKQRVVIINALLLNRKIFLLDEITSALDKAMKEKVINFFFTQPDFTILYISHDQYLPQGANIKTILLSPQ